MSAREDRSDRSFVEDVRRFGLLSTNTVVERYARLAERAIDGDDSPTPALPEGAFGGLAGPDAGDVAEFTARAATAWLGLLEATASLVDHASGAASSAERLELPPTEAGRVVQGTIWVHRIEAPSAPLELAVTTLAGSAGRVIPAEAVALSPTRLDAAPMLSSVEVRVRVQVPDGQAPGRYQGLISTSASDRPLLLQLHVSADGKPGP